MSRGKKKNKNKKQQQQPKQKSKNVPKTKVVKTIVVRPPPKIVDNRRKRIRKSSNMAGAIDFTPAAYNGRTSVKAFMQKSIRLKGCELLTTVSVPFGAPATSNSAVLNRADLNPLLLATGGRLSQFAELFDKFRYNKICVHYVPNVSTSTSGGLIVAADPDVLDNYTGQVGDTMVQSLTNCAHNMEFPVYQGCSMEIKDKRFFSDLLYTDPDVTTQDGKRWSSPGQLWWASTGPLASATSYGKLFVEWDITFSEPSNDSENSAGFAFIGTTSGTYVTSGFPWGDFNSIINNFTIGGTQFYYARPFVSFVSDPTAGSVIRFNAAGYYILAIVRFGAAMGTGAFTGAVYTNCSQGWPANASNMAAGTNAPISNGASNESIWVVNIYASQAGATISSTGDAGVTHTSSYVFVSRANLVAQVNGGFGAIQDRMNKLESWFKSISMGGPRIGSSCLTEDATSVTVTSDPSGGPDQTSTTTMTADIYNSLEAVNVVTPGFRAPDGYQLIPVGSPKVLHRTMIDKN